ncbi:MAG: hypothetical protein QM627_07495 [Luteolibacter sp.]
MNPHHLIVGTWKIPSTMVEGVDEFMHIGDDGRIVHFVYTDSSAKQFVPMMLWSEPQEEHRYLVRTRPRNEGQTVGMYSTASGMTIDRGTVQFHLIPASEKEIPDWYQQRLEDALSRMSQRELETTKAEQADAGNRRSAGA